ncbi:dCTP deaminase [Candidatus Gottesmanbacteria bacterium]|nr:dCTP deaminase [Candidatus Gottesmanbacteria bacterium]
MSILTHDEIKREIAEGNIKFWPEISNDQIKEASVDLHLGSAFRIYKKVKTGIKVSEDTDYKKYTTEVRVKEFKLHPHETVLGITSEKITLPGDICAWIEGRSRFARLGLLIHISAGLIQPGVDNKQVLEITNLSPNTLILQEGERICQLVFQRTSGTAVYKGKFRAQTLP